MGKPERYQVIKEHGGVCSHCGSKDLELSDNAMQARCNECNYNSRKISHQGLKEFMPSGFCVECGANFDDPDVEKQYAYHGPFSRICTDCGR